MNSEQPRDILQQCRGENHVGERLLPLTEFAKNRRVCKKCRAEAERQWRKDNAESVAAQAREYNQSLERKRKHRDQQRGYYWRDHD